MNREKHAAPNLAPAQFGKNLALSIASVSTSVVSGFFLAPFLIRHLGFAAYGLIPLINSTAMYMGLANIALNAATVRNVGIAITNGDYKRASDVFNTALWGSAAVGVLLFFIGAMASAYAPILINVPRGFESDARILFMTATVNVVLLMISSPLSVAIYYSNRLDKKAAMEVASRILYVLLVVTLVAGVTRRPAVVGVALVASSTLGIAQAIVWWRRHMPWLEARRVFSKALFAELVSFGGWSLVAYTGNLVFLTIDLIVVNRWIGPVEAGVYAALLQWPSMVRTLGTTIAGVFCQPMAHVYARDGADALFGYGVRAVRITSALLSVVVVILCGCATPLLRLWLGQTAAARSPLLWLLLGHLAFNMAALPLVAALQTVWRVRGLGFLTCCAACLDVVLAVLLVRSTGLGSYGVAAAGALVLTLLNAVAIPAYAANVFKRRVSELAIPLARAFVLTVTASVAAACATTKIGITAWAPLIISAAVVGCVASAAAALVLLNGNDRALAWAAIKGRSVRRARQGITQESA